MKTILQEREKIHYSISIWFKKLFICFKLWKFLQQKQQWQGMGKFSENVGVEPETNDETVHFAPLMDKCHCENTELETAKNYKSRVVLRGEIVNDDSGSYAVFRGQDSYGERQFEKIPLQHGWERFPIVNVHSYTVQKGFSFLCMWIWLARNQKWSDVERTQQRIRFGRTNIFLGSCIPGMHATTMPNITDIVDNDRTMFESRISAGGAEKLPFPQHLRISSWSFYMEGHARKCVVRYCELANKTTLRSIYSMHRWPPLQRRRSEICWRLSNTCSQNCCGMFTLGTNWKTWYSMVSE